MTREEVIEYWEGLRKTFSSQLEKEENHFGRMHLQTTIDVLDTTISALRQQEHFREVTKKVEPLTNAKKIRAMGDEELALNIGNGFFGCQQCSQGDCRKCDLECEKHCLEWLQQPAEEDEAK